MLVVSAKDLWFWLEAIQMVEVTANFSDETFALMSILANKRGLSVQEYLPRKMDETLEDEQDLRDAEETYADYLKNPETFRNFKELEGKWLK